MNSKPALLALLAVPITALLAFLVIFFIGAYFSAENNSIPVQVKDQKSVEVVSIYDGDTFRANIEGWPDIIGDRMPIRLARIDTPEIRGEEKEEGRISKQFTVEKLRGAKKVVITKWERGNFFRLIAEVWVDDENLSDLLLEAGLAEKWEE